MPGGLAKPPAWQAALLLLHWSHPAAPAPPCCAGGDCCPLSCRKVTGTVSCASFACLDPGYGGLGGRFENGTFIGISNGTNSGGDGGGSGGGGGGADTVPPTLSVPASLMLNCLQLLPAQLVRDAPEGDSARFGRLCACMPPTYIHAAA